MSVRLCDEDRERFGTAEWLDWSVLAVSIADVEELSDRFGFDPSEWPEPFFGRLTLDQAGDPDAKPKPPRWQAHAWAWMVLRQNGHKVSWDDAGTVRILLAQQRAKEKPVRGKGSTAGKASPSSEPSTTPPSSTSTD